MLYHVESVTRWNHYGGLIIEVVLICEVSLEQGSITYKSLRTLG